VKLQENPIKFCLSESADNSMFIGVMNFPKGRLCQQRMSPLRRSALLTESVTPPLYFRDYLQIYSLWLGILSVKIDPSFTGKCLDRELLFPQLDGDVPFRPVAGQARPASNFSDLKNIMFYLQINSLWLGILSAIFDPQPIGGSFQKSKSRITSRMETFGPVRCRGAGSACKERLPSSQSDVLSINSVTSVGDGLFVMIVPSHQKDVQNKKGKFNQFGGDILTGQRPVDYLTTS
jgi:hypothetical protein